MPVILPRLLLGLCAATTLVACASTQPRLTTPALTAGPILEGAARLPAGIIANNGGGIIANNGSGIIANNGGGIIAGNSGRYALAAVADDQPLADALIYLSDPKDNFYRDGGRMVSTTTNKQGAYRLMYGVPKGLPVIVSAILNGNRRIVGFTVPAEGTQRVDLSVPSTYVTEFLRDAAQRAGRGMDTYDLQQLPGLTDATAQAIAGDRLAVPDLEIGHIADLDRAYAIAVGANEQGLGDRWAQLLGRRVLAGVTVAGTGDAGSGGDGTAAASAELYRPRQVVADAKGNLYIADEGNNRIRKVDAQTGTISTVAGTGRSGFSGDGGPAVRAQLADPRTVAVDAAGNLYIGDQANARIRKVDAATGLISTIVGAPTADGAGGWVGGHSGDGGPAAQAKLFAPRSIVVDASGNLYITDAEHETTFHTIRRVDAKTGIITTIAGTPNAEGAFAGDGGPATQARLNYPNQLALDAKGGLLIADTNNHCIRRVDLATGVIATVAGIGGQEGSDPDGQSATQTHLSSPYGVAVTPDGRIYFSERTSGRVRAILSDGTLRTVAGGGTDVRDGEATMLRLVQPHDLCVESDGNLLVADTRGSRIRRIVTKFGL
jgi:sugar lactone lactonase YvrE